MNLRTILATTTAALALTSASAANAGSYLTFFGGVSTFDDEIDFATSQTNGYNVVTPITVLGSFHGPIGKSTYMDLGITAFVGKSLSATSQFNWEDDFENGFVVGAAFGVSLTNTLRAELEVAYRSSDVDGGGTVDLHRDGRQSNFGYIAKYKTIYNTLISKTVFKTAYTIPYVLPPTASGQAFPFNINLPTEMSDSASFASDGEVSVWSLMANVWLDIDPFGVNPDGVTTFIGGGVGMAKVELDYDAEFNDLGHLLGTGTVNYSLDDSENVWAYQMGAGVAFDLGGGASLSAQYRWFATEDVTLGGTDMRVESHNALVGLTWGFGGN